MLYVLICTDKPDALEIRVATRPAHLAWVDSLGPKLILAGPFLSDDGATPIGSLIVIEADSRAEVDALAVQDPYAIAGLFQLVDIRPWKWLINPPTG